MAALRPSFHTIYRQGRLRARLVPESSDAIEQRERFAVACVASVLHHDQEFRADFLSRICDWQDRDAAPEFAIWVEKNGCGDLVLENQIRRVVFVLECKIGAPLQRNQTPDSDFFFSEGYGRGIAAEYRDAPGQLWQRTYITLEQSDNGKSYLDAQGIECRARRWDALTAHREPADLASSLVHDLFYTLSALHIRCFAAWDMKTRNMNLAEHYFHACAIKELLQNSAVLLKNQMQLSAEDADDSELKTANDSYIGRALVCKKAPQAWLKFVGLDEARPSDHLGWYGYVWGRIQVGFYAKGTAARSALKALAAITKEGEEETGRDGDYIWIASTGNHKGDQEWFLSVFERIAVRLSS